jgi:2-dehydro-3-deoxyphosphogalactonate aldolase
MSLRFILERMPFIAILRGVTPDEVAPIGVALAKEGFGIIEVPMNSPSPFDSIRRLRDALGDTCMIGAGTVTTVQQVADVAATGGRLIVMPHGDPAVIISAKSAGLVCMPGVATPTEGFAALAHGADALKLFPAELLGPPVLKAWRAVFPAPTLFLPVGGITPINFGEFFEAGAAGFGLGSALYKPGLDVAEVTRRAHTFVDTWRTLRTESEVFASPGKRLSAGKEDHL